MNEEPLPGGIANAGAVTRLGGQVLRPAGPHAASIHRLMRSVRAAGFDGVPVPAASGQDGRERLEYIDGEVPVPPYPEWAQSGSALESVASLLRRFHRASASFDLAGTTWSAELADPAGCADAVCHNDVCLENVVFRDGQAVALLDFDFAAPGRPVYDLARLALMCVPVDDDLSAARLGWQPADKVERLALVAEAYSLDAAGRASLLEILSEMIARGGEFVRRQVEAGNQNFAHMWNEMGGAERFDRRRRWWSAQHGAFAARFL
jgi:aminoglycoside phosphotransferase (APT) family kinase protein